jgi:hypothetical protein
MPQVGLKLAGASIYGMVAVTPLRAISGVTLSTFVANMLTGNSR